jgi:hypothetical protein
MGSVQIVHSNRVSVFKTQTLLSPLPTDLLQQAEDRQRAQGVRGVRRRAPPESDTHQLGRRPPEIHQSLLGRHSAAPGDHHRPSEDHGGQPERYE